MEQLEGAMRLLDDIDELVTNGTRVPITGKVVLDQSMMLELLDKVRGLLPQELQQAQQVNKERQRVLQEAKQEAERILNEARSQIDRMVNEDELVKRARAQAEDIVKQAQKTAKQIRAGSTDYADDVLNNLEMSLEKTLAVVRKGRQELQSTKAKHAS